MHILSFFIGLLAALASLPDIFLFILFLFLIFAYYSLVKPISILIVSLMFLAGYIWTEIHIYLHFREKLSSILEGKAVNVEGWIDSVPADFGNYSRFQFKVQTLENHPWKNKIILSWYKLPYFYKNTRTLHVGEKWHFIVRLKKPRGFRNPGSFDYEAWLFEQHIEAKGYIIENKKTKGQNYLIESAQWHNWIDQVRQKVERIWQPFSEKWPLVNVLLALTVGLTNGITAEQWQVFTNTGTIHLISISGLHISFIAGIAFTLVSFFWRRIPFFCQFFPAQRAGAMGALLIGVIYSLLAGFSLPTQRSLIMLAVYMGGILLQRQTNVWQCFGLSVLLVTLWEPFSPLNLSFWLSYSAVAIILYVMIEPSKKENSSGKFYIKAMLVTVGKWLKLQLYIFLGLLPFSFFWFSQISVSSLWANLIAIPVTELLILPTALVSIIVSAFCMPIAVFLMSFCHWVFSLVYYYLSWISNNHPVIWSWSLNSAWMLLLGVAGIALLLAPRGFPGRWLGWIFWLPLLCPIKVNDIHYGEANFSLLDVGQGLASVIETKNHVVIFDTGPKLSESLDTGKAVVLPYLKNQHIQKVDAIVISHADMDHRGGLMSILKGIKVKRVYVNDLHILKKAQLCLSNVSWLWDGVKFEFLTKGLAAFNSTNDTSCVLKISNAHHSILLPGDLEKRGEKLLMQTYGEKLRTDLIVAGHHGSKTSSSSEWVDLVHPRYVLWAIGYMNRYHFPHADIVKRYKKIETQDFSTVECGMIQWKLSNTKKTNTPLCYRHKSFHFYEREN